MSKRKEDSSIVRLKGPFTPSLTVGSTVWSIEERHRLAEGLTSTDGHKRVHCITKHVKTKTNADVREYLNGIKSIEKTKEAPEFNGKAPIDVWINITKATTHEKDLSAAVCIPQVMTVASLEPSHRQLHEGMPNYPLVYDCIGKLLKGEELPELQPLESRVVLCLLEDLVKKLAFSDTHNQRIQLHSTYRRLKAHLLQSQGTQLPASNEHKRKANDKSSEETSPKPVRKKSNIKSNKEMTGELQKFPSLNPLGIPTQLLNFKWKTQML